MQLQAYCELCRSAVVGRACFKQLVDVVTESRSIEPKIPLLKAIPKDIYTEAYPVIGADNIYLAGSSMIEKRVLDCERDVREVSRQSVVTTREIAPGEMITREMLTIKRPGTGILAYRLDEVVGSVAKRAIEADVPIVEEDLA